MRLGEAKSSFITQTRVKFENLKKKIPPEKGEFRIPNCENRKLFSLKNFPKRLVFVNQKQNLSDR
jgi:hypothetical protein